MKPMRLGFMMAVLLSGATATAQVSDDLDAIGIYFDLDATLYCHQHTPGPAPQGILRAYLLLTNPSTTADISGWQCRLEVLVPSGGCLLWGYEYSAAASNALSPPNFAVTVFNPLPNQNIVHLLTLTLYVSCHGEWRFSVHPVVFGGMESEPPEWPSYMGSDNPMVERPMYQVTGAAEYPVAVLNGGCDVIDQEEISWGAVKSLYR
jgi:hypothetical protein